MVLRMITVVTVFFCLNCKSLKVGSTERSGRVENREALLVNISPGMTYAQVVTVLGEPDINLGYGELSVIWKLGDNCWFVPDFDGDKLVAIATSHSDPFAP